MKELLEKVKAFVKLVLLVSKDALAGVVVAVREAVAKVLHKIELLVLPK